MSNLNKPVVDDDNDSVLFERLQRNAIEHYPNPSRHGCPPSEILARFVESPAEVSVSELNNLHIFHCAECTMDLQALRESREKRLEKSAASKQIQSRKWWIAAAAIIAVCILTPIWNYLRMNSTHDIRDHEASLVLSDASTERGPETGLILFRSRLTLHIMLPRANSSGKYEVTLSKQRAMENPALRLVSESKEAAGDREITVKLDLRTVPAGEYWIGVRSERSSAPWFTYVVLQ